MTLYRIARRELSSETAFLSGLGIYTDVSADKSTVISSEINC